MEKGQLVSPVHAGIDLGPGITAVSLYGFPRTRGDRPRRQSLDMQDLQFPPYTRG